MRKKERKKENNKNQTKKDHVKHVIKSDQLIHFCLMMSSVLFYN